MLFLSRNMLLLAPKNVTCCLYNENLNDSHVEDLNLLDKYAVI